METEYTVTKEWLHQHLDDAKIIVADCRYHLTDPLKARKEYEEGHIPGAIFFDLKEDLSGEVTQHGGRHPLPDVESFTSLMRKRGINEEKHVVIYDDQNGSMAGRLWWLLKYVGQNRASILDENFSEWKKQGYPVSTEVSETQEVQFEAKVDEEMLLSMSEVKARKDRNGVALIDARAPERFSGKTEPLDQKAGHIPGAKNMFWKNNIQDDGKWKSPKELVDLYKELANKEEVIVYCGSGVSANANIIALQKAGIKNVKLYAGSWSDWSSYEENPVEKL